MDADEDLITRFIRYENMALVIHIFEPELGELQRGEPDSRDTPNELLRVGRMRIELVIARPLDLSLGSERINGCARVKSIQEVGRRGFRGGMRGIIVDEGGEGEVGQ